MEISPVLLGIDIGTTTLTCLAVDSSGSIRARSTMANRAESTSEADKRRGRSEWSASEMLAATWDAVRSVSDQLGEQVNRVASIGVTGQQHGGVLVGKERAPLSPLVNWQDRRGQDPFPGSSQTYLEVVLERLGTETPRRTGCRMVNGFWGVTLFWLNQQSNLPDGVPCCIMDLAACELADVDISSEPSSAGSSGLLNARERSWDEESIARLDLGHVRLPQVCEADQPLGTLCSRLAQATGLPAGIPVQAALGDNQASFLGSVSRPEETILVNVGTGGQVAAAIPDYQYFPPLETRPLPLGGNLLVDCGLCGGRTYAYLERFLQQVGRQLFGVEATGPLFDRMNELAAELGPDTDGVACRPIFTGTRTDPNLRASWSGFSPESLTPAHLVRSLLEGMATVFHESSERICQASPAARTTLIGAGNGVRHNRVLSQCLASRFRLPLYVPRHLEEAAFGAALLGGVAAGVFADRAEALGTIAHGLQAEPGYEA